MRLIGISPRLVILLLAIFQVGRALEDSGEPIVPYNGTPQNATNSTTPKELEPINSNPVNSSVLPTEKIKGISLGGWLVTEPYITPSLFWSAIHWSQDGARSNTSIVDEFTMCQVLGQERAKVILMQHYRSWITKNDIQEIKKHGFNLVRIPIGYWAWKRQGTVDSYIEGLSYYDPYVGGIQLHYLNLALEWCREAGLKVWLDLHGVPGSQNGFDNSGQRIIDGELGWLKKEGSRILTRSVLRNIFKTYLKGEWKDVVTGVEVVNEPMASGIGIDNIIDFYDDIIDDYAEIVMGASQMAIITNRVEKNQHTNNNVNNNGGADKFPIIIKKKPLEYGSPLLVLHEAFQKPTFWNSYWNDTKVPIMIDHHHYEVFSHGQLVNDQFTRLSNIMEYGECLKQEQEVHPSVVGEWSAALSDCATWLNGIGIGARYDGSYYKTYNPGTKVKVPKGIPGKCKSHAPISQWDEAYKTHVRQFIEAQLVSYSSSNLGWIFWNWKTENAPEWDYLKLSNNGLFPRPFDNFTYFNKDGTLNTGMANIFKKGKGRGSHMKAFANSAPSGKTANWLETFGTTCTLILLLASAAAYMVW